MKASVVPDRVSAVNQSRLRLVPDSVERTERVDLNRLDLEQSALTVRNVRSESVQSVRTDRLVVNLNVTMDCIQPVNNKCTVSSTRIRPSRFV